MELLPILIIAFGCSQQYHTAATLSFQKRRRQENLIHACGPVQPELQAECTPQSQNCNHFYIYHFMVGLSHKKEIQQWFLVSPEFFNNSTKRKRIWLPVQINQVEYLDNWNGEMWLKVGLFQKKDGHPIAQEFFKGPTTTSCLKNFSHFFKPR